MKAQFEISKTLIAWVQRVIIPMYASVDPAHNWGNHISIVVDNALTIATLMKAKKKDLNVNVVYAAASLHDIGLVSGREDHHLSGGNFVRNSTADLRSWFDDDEIEVIAQAVEDHRGSTKMVPRTIYSSIVSDADKIQNLEGTIVVLIDSIEEFRLTTKEVQAILLHEEAHLKHGDLVKLMWTDEELAAMSDEEFFSSKPRISVNLDYELAADAYSASKVGKFTMLTAYYKLARGVAKLLAEIHGEKYEEVLIELMADDEWKLRTEALS